MKPPNPRSAVMALFIAFAVLGAACSASTSGDLLIVDDGSGDSAPSAAALSSGLAGLREVETYRLSWSTGLTIKALLVGEFITQELDRNRPVVIAELSSTDDMHVVVDLGALFAPPTTSTSNFADLANQRGFEFWVVGDEMVLDATGFELVATINPTLDLGPLTPGIGSIDLSRLDAIVGAELVRELSGSSYVNLKELAQLLPGALEDVTQISVDPVVLAANVPHNFAMRLVGGDPEEFSRLVAAPVAANFAVSVDDVAEFYFRYAEARESTVEITLEGDVVSAVHVRVDVSDIFSAISAPDSGFDLGASDAELSEYREHVVDTKWVIEILMTIEADDSIVISPPVGDFEDRTHAMIEFLAALGG